MLRKALAVVAGYVLTVLLILPLSKLSAQFAAPGAQSQVIVVTAHLLAYFLAAFAGGYACAWIARAPWPGRILAALVLLGGLLYVGSAGSGAYFTLLPFAGGLGAFAGSWLRTS
jgi:hypothetical protein